MFRKTLKATTAAIALLATIGSAHADLKMVGNSGPWKTYAGIADNGRPMCSANLTGQDRQLMVKYQAGAAFLQVGKVGWHIPDKQDVDI